MSGDEFRAKAAADPARDREHDLTTAWRATLGTAAATADRFAKVIEDHDSGPSGRPRAKAREVAKMVRLLADELFAMRDRDPRELDVTMAGLLGAPWPPQEGRSRPGSEAGACRHSDTILDGPDEPGGRAA